MPAISGIKLLSQTFSCKMCLVTAFSLRNPISSRVALFACMVLGSIWLKKIVQVRISLAEKVGSLTNIPLGVLCVCGFVWDGCVCVGGGGGGGVKAIFCREEG